MDNSEEALLHIVMFPWLAVGHFIPFLHLSKYLARKGHRISFITTSGNLQRLPKIPAELEHLIILLSFPLPKVDNLPDQAESSMDIPYQKAQFLKIGFDMLKWPIADFLQNSKPRVDWIIYDYASHWLPPLARELGISSAYFSLFNAAFMAFLGPPSASIGLENDSPAPQDFTVVPEWIPFKSSMAYRPHEVKFIEIATGKESGISDSERFAISVDGSEVVLFRTCVDFEPEWFDLVCKLYKKPTIPLGILPPSVQDDDDDDDEWDNSEKWLSSRQWLDKQKASSVVYVALGSEAILSKTELSTLALGLELCKLPFFWVLRRPPGSESVQDVLQMLPDGYEDRVKTRGKIYVGWVPQVKILSHVAIGGFLTHCGWNSVIEGLLFGRVLILFPMINDQAINARLLQEKKLGLEIPRDEHDGTFTGDSVADSVRLAMVSEEGELVRTNASEMRDMLGNQNKNNHYIDSLVHYLRMKVRTSQSLA